METTTGDVAGDGIVFDVAGLWQQLARITDRRRARGKRYALPLLMVLMVLMVLAKLCGEDRPSGIADWVRHRRAALQAMLGRPLPRAPHHNTYRRVLAQALDPADLDAAVGDFLRQAPGAGQRVLVSIDGKTIRGTIAAPARRGEHLLAA